MSFHPCCFLLSAPPKSPTLRIMKDSPKKRSLFDHFGFSQGSFGSPVTTIDLRSHDFLVGGFDPFEKYSSKWESSPIFGVKIKILETTYSS